MDFPVATIASIANLATIVIDSLISIIKDVPFTVEEVAVIA